MGISIVMEHLHLKHQTSYALNLMHKLLVRIVDHCTL